MTACRECRFCYTLYIPRNKNEEAKYENCCVLFLNEGIVTKLDNINEEMCECFTRTKR